MQNTGCDLQACVFVLEVKKLNLMLQELSFG